MIISFDTQEVEYPCRFGELLREFCFVEEYGCYTCFELIPGFEEKPLTNREFFLLWGREPSLGEPENYYGWRDEDFFDQAKWFENKPLDIEVGWHWDGDGCLFIREKGKAVYNSDCKKDYEWNWVDLTPHTKESE